eukprot:scaffold862_cov216-Pinguiococcus_pyrenoidosus.AAC.1
MTPGAHEAEEVKAAADDGDAAKTETGEEEKVEASSAEAPDIRAEAGRLRELYGALRSLFRKE